jgi:hypothetical protein
VLHESEGSPDGKQKSSSTEPERVWEFAPSVLVRFVTLAHSSPAMGSVVREAKAAKHGFVKQL